MAAALEKYATSKRCLNLVFKTITLGNQVWFLGYREYLLVGEVNIDFSDAER